MGKNYHSVAQAEWGAHLQRQSTGNLKNGDVSSRHRSAGFVIAGDYRALITGCGPGPSLQAEGMPAAAWSATPPHAHGVSNRERGGGARGIAIESRCRRLQASSVPRIFKCFKFCRE